MTIMNEPKFIHLSETPCIFYFNNDVFTLPGFKKEILAWFKERQPVHYTRNLVNAEREKYGASFCIIFDSISDAVEFKMRFV